MTPKIFVTALSNIELANVFNPYRDECNIHDSDGAAITRCNNLESYLLSALSIEVDTIWMGRDLGYRGGRRTGVALTDEYHLSELRNLFPTANLIKATHGKVVAERTAAEIWYALRRVPKPPLFWNVFPFHPHERDSSLTNRRFTAKELTAVEDLNATLISWFGIKQIVAIGQDAFKYSKRFGLKLHTVRHPSYGGSSDFRRGICEFYGLDQIEIQRTILVNSHCNRTTFSLLEDLMGSAIV
ncbi:MAG: uracil-DNA glycosylase [Methylophilaceae bacterium]